MKKKILFPLFLGLMTVSLTGCSSDDPDGQSIITDSNVSENAFDKWIKYNYTIPYNIEFQYRYNDNETDLSFRNVPANYTEAVEMAHIVKYTCIDAYDQVAGINFTRNYFPKILCLSGNFQYQNNGTMRLGYAEGGKKIYLTGVNSLGQVINDIEALNEYYLRTIHHEFTHILNQTTDFPSEFSQVTGTDYVNDAWSTSNYLSGYLQRGFISAYSQKEAREDFAEMMSLYITNTSEQWDAWMAQAANTDLGGSSDAESALEQKLELVKTYMSTVWNIDLDKLRDEVLQRENDVANGIVDLTDLSVE